MRSLARDGAVVTGYATVVVPPIIARLGEIVRLDHPDAFVIGRPRRPGRAWRRCTTVIPVRNLNPSVRMTSSPRRSALSPVYGAQGTLPGLKVVQTGRSRAGWSSMSVQPAVGGLLEHECAIGSCRA